MNEADKMYSHEKRSVVLLVNITASALFGVSSFCFVSSERQTAGMIFMSVRSIDDINEKLILLRIRFRNAQRVHFN